MAYLLRPIEDYRLSKFSKSSREFRNVDYTGTNTIQHADPLLELLLLANLLPLSERLEARLTQLQSQTQGGLVRIKELLSNEYLRWVILQWDSLTVREVRWLEGAEFKRPLAPESLPSGQDWFDALVNLQVSETLDRRAEENPSPR